MKRPLLAGYNVVESDISEFLIKNDLDSEEIYSEFIFEETDMTLFILKFGEKCKINFEEIKWNEKDRRKSEIQCP